MSLNLLLVTFSLRNPNKDYSLFFVTARGNAVNWLHYIEQTIILSAPLSPQELSQQLLPHLETTDSLFVTKITPHEFQGWLPIQVWDWLNTVSNAIVAENETTNPLSRLLPPRLPR